MEEDLEPSNTVGDLFSFIFDSAFFLGTIEGKDEETKKAMKKEFLENYKT